jgi:hypothetical protein
LIRTEKKKLEASESRGSESDKDKRNAEHQLAIYENYQKNFPSEEEITSEHKKLFARETLRRQLSAIDPHVCSKQEGGNCVEWVSLADQ